MRRPCRPGSRNRESGSAVALALVVVTLIAGFALSFLRITSSSTSRQVTDTEQMQAFYLAEAGLAEAFQAIRVGRTGQIGSETAPAQFGQGILWVDATYTNAGQVRLESTGLVGRGRSTLSFVVEPVADPLGFFTDDSLVVDSVVLVDGYNSDKQAYEDEVAAAAELQVFLAEILQTVAAETFLEYVAAADLESLIRVTGLESETATQLEAVFDTVVADFESGALFRCEPFASVTAPEPDVVSEPEIAPELWGSAGGGASKRNLETLLVSGDSLDLMYTLGEPLLVEEPVATSTVTIQEPLTHTNSGGLLRTNGDMVFELPAGEGIEVFGDVRPGPAGSIVGAENSFLGGNTTPADQRAELVPVELPDIPLQAPVLHEDALPMVVSPGDSGFESVTVASGAELILRGPGRVLVEHLTLEEGATLTLDTRDGPLDLFVTGGMQLHPGSVTETTGVTPTDVTLQVGPIETLDGSAPVSLDSTAQFHGTVYAPQAKVYLGSDFEVYGGVMAQSLELGPGAKLHFDNAGFDGSGLPDIVSWRIVEIAPAARSRARNPFIAMGVAPEDVRPMAEAHDLDSVELSIEYLDQVGSRQQYKGRERLFDWDRVKDILCIERENLKTQPPADQPATAPPGTRQDVYDAIMAFNGTNLAALGTVRQNYPLSGEEWAVILTRDPAVLQTTINLVAYEDAQAGGTSGPPPPAMPAFPPFN